MERGKISIINGTVSITTVDGNVWLTRNEIARMFGCFVSKVGDNIRSIFKSGVLDEAQVYRLHRSPNGNRIDRAGFSYSENADIFRQGVMQKALTRTGLLRQ